MLSKNIVTSNGNMCCDHSLANTMLVGNAWVALLDDDGVWKPTMISHRFIIYSNSNLASLK
jgi:hypothetical protein